MLKAKIRGIYTTALTKLLIENGFEIIDPSKPIRERFGLAENTGFPNLKIKDRFDRQGVRAIGDRKAIDRFREIVHHSLEDAITRKWPVSLDGIYKGKITGETGGFLLVDIGDAVGKLPKYEASSHEDKVVLVQVERKRIGSKTPLLSTKMKILGRYAILINTNKIGVSLKIRDVKKRFELYQLGKELAPAGWGIIWRKEAEFQPHETLEEEVKELIEKAERIMEKFESADVPSIIFEGLYCMDIEFPALSKRKLDEIRGEVAVTLNGHHYYKACGGKVSSALEMAEKLLEKGKPLEEVEPLFKKTVEGEYPIEGSPIKIEHVKLSGKILSLGRGIIEEINENNICFRRVFHKPGVYDGLGTRKEPGDTAITNVKIGDWILKTSYYSCNGAYKGTYINLNTPVELYPHGIRYVDLEVDICVLPDGTTKILDGKILSLGRGIIEEINENNICFKRIFHKSGVYDGLGTRKEPGDTAITNVKIGDWILKTSYYSCNGAYKGTYINLNTPVELYPHGIRYVDLEVDICVLPDGTVKILDEDKLWKAVEEGLITKKLANLVMEKARKIVNEFNSKE